MALGRVSHGSNRLDKNDEEAAAMEEGLVPATFVQYFGEELEARPPTPPLPPQKSKLMGNRNLCHVKVCLIMD